MFAILRDLGTDRISIEMLQEDINKMVSLLSFYLNNDIERASNCLSIYKDKQLDVIRYQEKWSKRAKSYSDVIDYMKTFDFLNAMKTDDNEDIKEIYARYIPVLQSLYDTKSEATQKVECTERWLELLGILEQLSLGGENNNDE